MRSYFDQLHVVVVPGRGKPIGIRHGRGDKITIGI